VQARRNNQFGSDDPMAITVSKLIAVVIALGYFVTALVVEKPGAGEGILLFLGLLVPLALIWFPQSGSAWPRKKTALYTYEDSFGPRTGRWRDSHPWLVTFMGWFFLLGLPIILYLIWR
jgi:hypothetical protein